MTDHNVTVLCDCYRVWAECTCGWKGSKRYTKPPAQADAAQHMSDTGHPAQY